MSTLLKALHRAQQPQPQTCIPAMGLAMPREEARTSRHLVWLLAPLALLLGAGANYGWHLIHLRPIEEKVERGEVVAVGAGRVSDNGARILHGINVGDIVLHNKYGGAEVEVDGEKLFILHAAEIIAVVG